MIDPLQTFLDEHYKESIILSVNESVPQLPTIEDRVLAHHCFTKELGYTDQYTIPRIIQHRIMQAKNKRIRYYDAPENIIIIHELAKQMGVSAPTFIRNVLHDYLRSKNYVPVQISSTKQYTLTRKELVQYNAPDELLKLSAELSRSTSCTVL